MSYVRLSTEWKRCLRQRSLFVLSSALFLPMPENGPQAFDLATLQISLAFSCHAGPYLCLSPLTGNLRRSRNMTVVIRELPPRLKSPSAIYKETSIEPMRGRHRVVSRWPEVLNEISSCHSSAGCSSSRPNLHHQLPSH